MNKFLGLCRSYHGEKLLSYQIPTEVMISFWKDILDKSKYIEQIDILLELVREIEIKNTKAIVFNR